MPSPIDCSAFDLDGETVCYGCADDAFEFANRSRSQLTQIGMLSTAEVVALGPDRRCDRCGAVLAELG